MSDLDRLAKDLERALQKDFERDLFGERYRFVDYPYLSIASPPPRVDFKKLAAEWETLRMSKQFNTPFMLSGDFIAGSLKEKDEYAMNVNDTRKVTTTKVNITRQVEAPVIDTAEETVIEWLRNSREVWLNGVLLKGADVWHYEGLDTVEDGTHRQGKVVLCFKNGVHITFALGPKCVFYRMKSDVPVLVS